MGALVSELKAALSAFVEPPWRHSGPDGERGLHWAEWLIGWAWRLAGLVLGAFIAPVLVQYWGVADTPFQDPLVIGTAVLASFLVQWVGWVSLAVALELGNVLDDIVDRGSTETRHPIESFAVEFALLASLIPVAAVGIGLYFYVNGVGVDQRSITVAFVGTLLVKAFLIPLIKGIVTGALFRWVPRGA